MFQSGTFAGTSILMALMALKGPEEAVLQGEFLKIANRPVDNLLSLGLQSYRRLDMVKELIQGQSETFRLLPFPTLA